LPQTPYDYKEKNEPFIFIFEQMQVADFLRVHQDLISAFQK